MSDGGSGRAGAQTSAINVRARMLIVLEYAYARIRCQDGSILILLELVQYGYYSVLYDSYDTLALLECAYYAYEGSTSVCS